MISALTAFLQAKALSFLVVLCVSASEQLYSILLLVCPFGCCLVAKSCPTLATPWMAACQASLSFTISQSLLKFVSIDSDGCYQTVSLSVAPLLLLPSIFPSIRVFSILEMRKLRFRKVDCLPKVTQPQMQSCTRQLAQSWCCYPCWGLKVVLVLTGQREEAEDGPPRIPFPLGGQRVLRTEHSWVDLELRERKV